VRLSRASARIVVAACVLSRMTHVHRRHVWVSCAGFDTRVFVSRRLASTRSRRVRVLARAPWRALARALLARAVMVRALARPFISSANVANRKAAALNKGFAH